MSDSDISRYRQPQELAARHEVSPSTLRRWSDEFAEFLSPEASSSEGKQHRRYSDDDLATFITVKGLMADGMTYDQVRERLAEFLQGLFGGAGLLHGKTKRPNEVAEQSALRCFVVDDQDGSLRFNHQFGPTRRWSRRRGVSCSRPASRELWRFAGQLPGRAPSRRAVC